MSDQAPKILKLVMLMAGILWGMVLSSCTEKSEPQTPAFSRDFESFDLATNAFEVCQSKESEKKTFLKFFTEGGYRLSADPGVEALDEFFEAVRVGYSVETENLDYSLIKREYHTFTHAMDVMITIHALFEAGAGVFFTPDEKAVLLLAALGHDVLHSGVNNGFLAKTKHPWVEQFGADGVQEKRSVQFMEKVLEKYGIFEISDTNQSSRSLRMLRQSILWTDFSRHTDLMNQVSEIIPKLELPKGPEQKRRISADSILNQEERILLASFLLHCADVSNPGKEWTVAEKWAYLVMNEFFAQGDLEKSLGIEPSMNCDRLKVKIPECQIGFAKYVVHDLYTQLEKIAPKA
ncbi:MAG: 3',5'-cyclic nucleotide phosphodiesterase, partial [Opitutae bacterium]